jgi:prevent-host-death family protein
MTKITAAEFKAKCLRILDEVKETREPVIVTKRGQAVARVMPMPAPPKSLYGIAKGEITWLSEDIYSTGEVWEADS